MPMTTIQIAVETREELKRFGMKSEKYDDIIRHLMDIAKRHAFFERQKRILEGGGFVPLDEV